MAELYLSHKEQQLLYDVLKSSIEQSVFLYDCEKEIAKNVINKLARRLNKRQETSGFPILCEVF